jgi:hypothetical protein
VSARCASAQPRRVSRHTESALSKQNNPFIYNRFTLALAVPFPWSQDVAGPGDTHDRHTALRNTRCNHSFRRGCRRRPPLASSQSHVHFDAPRDGAARGFSSPPCQRDGAVGAGLRSASLSAATTARSPRGRWQDSRPKLAAEWTVTAPPQHPGSKSEGSNTMLALKYLLMILGVGLFGSAGSLVVYDIYISEQLRRLLAQ